MMNVLQLFLYYFYNLYLSHHHLHQFLVHLHHLHYNVEYSRLKIQFEIQFLLRLTFLRIKIELIYLIFQ